MKRKKLTSLALTILLVGTLIVLPFSASAESRDVSTKLQLWYDEPASTANSSDTWQQATLPIGNGILGANVYGEFSKEHLTVNEETLWSGGRGSVGDYNGGNPSTSRKNVYDSLSNHYLSGTSTQYSVEDLAGVSANSSGYYNGYQALGDVYFDFGHSGSYSGYTRALDLEAGVSTVNYTYDGVDYARTFFASNPDNVIVSHFTAGTNGKLNFTASFTSKQSAAISAKVSDSVGYITAAGTVSNNGLLHNTQIAVVTDGSLNSNGTTVTVSGATTATVYLTAATDYKNTFYNADKSIAYYYRTGETADQLSTRVSSALNAAVEKGYDNIRSAHAADYTKLYSRVELDLGQSCDKTTDALLTAYKSGSATAEEQRYLEVLMFQYGRYLLIAGSRENSQLPTTLQGIWNNSNTAPWYSDIHTNINLEMNYWLSSNCNLTECALPLVNYMANLAEPGGRTVQIYTGCEYGIMAHTQNTPFGYTSPGWAISTWGWSPAAATWLMQNCYDYYEYSGDVDTLRNTIYPMLKEQVLMYQVLLKEKNGRLVMPITQSPELSTITAGNTYEQSLIWQLYADTIEAAKILGLDSDQISAWQSTMDHLNPIEIGTSGQVKEWYTETTINSVNDTRSHRHLSNMLGLYPGNLFDTQEEIDAAIVSLNNKNFGHVGTNNNPEGGWTYGQLINSWARVGDGENAYFSVKTMLQNRVFANLWDWHSGGSYGLFQIDGNYGYSAGVGEMLLQSNLGYINPLPAIPGVWANGSVKGLLAEGGFEVAMKWSDSALTEFAVTSTKGGSCSVKYPLAENATLKITCDGEDVSYTEKNGVFTFDTTAGSSYTFTQTVYTPASAVRNADGSVTITWDAQPGVTYHIIRKEIAG